VVERLREVNPSAVWGVAPRTHPRELPARAGILVIGGGITGVSLLYWLRGRDVVLVERDRLASGASGRNAGFIGQDPSNYATAVRRHGRQRTGALKAFTVETHDLLEEAIAGRSPHHRRRGHISLPATAQEARDLEESAVLMREDGFDAEWDGRRLLDPRAGEHNPVETVLALASFTPAGAVRDGVEVTRLETSSAGVRVEAAGRECQAEVVVLATNAYTPTLVPEVRIAPVRGQMAATAPLAGTVSSATTSRDRGFQYWNQLWDGRVIVGGYRDRAIEEEVGYEITPTARLQGHLDAHLRELGVTAPVTHRWAGIMGFTEGGLPLVGPVAGRPNLYVCGGYNGNGMSYAFHCARRLAAHLVGSETGPLVPWD
jgi:glycine/D-amino acid oxidase-like deaminating enzyme